MTRFILALLAMLSGICAIGQPVAAHVRGAEASAERQIDCTVVAESVATRAVSGVPIVSAIELGDDAAAIRPAYSTVLPRTVRIRCDRALE